ncbi:MAG: AI-2E family transporter [Magnetococcales bacterium]|nr:AI-2E family transporter [Magnetococcales bacterium]
MKADDPDALKTHPLIFQEGFIAILLLLAISGLTWLFLPFLPGLFLATVLAASTYPLFHKLQERYSLKTQSASLLMTGLVFVLIITPIVYLLSVISVGMSRFVTHLKSQITGLSPAELISLKERLLARLPVPDEVREALVDQFSSNMDQVTEAAKNISLFLFKSIFGNTAAFLSSLMLILFTLFFLYRDGPAIVRQIKIISPLANHLDDFIMQRFAKLATVLTLSTLSVALIQGVSISLVTSFMGLPWFSLGVAVAVTAFVPILGSVLVWGPAAYWLIAHDQWLSGIFLIFWGGVINGFFVDNLLRPILITRFAQIGGEEMENGSGPLAHTLLTVLSTLGGILTFGILGLFFGPLIAAMAITIFEIYEMEYGHRLDYSRT